MAERKYPELPSEYGTTNIDINYGWRHFDTWCKENKVKDKDRIKYWDCWTHAQDWDDKGHDW